MKKEFGPYELAVKLKALGFPQDFSNDGIWYYATLSSGEIKYFCWTCCEDEPPKMVDPIIAPTFSQAFRWFREKYNMQYAIKFTHSKYSFDIHFETLANGENPPVMVWNLVDSWLGLNLDLFETYEKAELACLTKLIEIVETELNKSE